MQYYDYLIVGAGFSGSVLAERLASQLNKKVLIIDRRPHLGGNCYDYYNKNGVLIQKYGAHLFHTKYKEVFDYLSNFTSWHKYEHRVKAWIDGEIYDLPINLNTVNKFFGKNFTPRQCKKFLEKIRVKIKKPKNAQEQVVSKVGWEIYRKFFEKYTLKQWERHPKKLEPLVTARIPIRFNTDDRYFDDPYQFMPNKGFTKLFEKMLLHKNITVKLKTDFKEIRNLDSQRKLGLESRRKSEIRYDNLIYTGCIDEFFDYKFGHLPYRSLKFKFKTFNKPFYQKYTVINYPNDFKYTKVVEIKHATKQRINKTTIGYEFPSASGEPYYPIPQLINQKLYQKYLALTKNFRNVFFLGRLGQYQYLNMDQVVLAVLNLYKKLAKI
ncbi:MAG: UDP-galactopyranose mutase [Patescibacteria group bacterium]